MGMTATGHIAQKTGDRQSFEKSRQSSEKKQQDIQAFYFKFVLNDMEQLENQDRRHACMGYPLALWISLII